MSAIIHYHDIGDYLSREEKLKIIDDFGDIDGIEWQTLTPDKHGDWLNKRNSEFDDYIPLAPEKKFDYLSKSFFTVYSLGLNSNRDAWSYNHSRGEVVRNMKRMVEFYNDQVEVVRKGGKASNDAKRISWSSSLMSFLERKELAAFQENRVVLASYRPFVKEHLYFGEKMVHRRCQWDQLFPTAESRNRVICVSGETVLMTDCIPDLHFCGDVQAFPLYWYEEIKAETSVMELPGLEK